MKPVQFVIFTHSLISDWNHGNAHFLRGVVRELQRRGHRVRVLEPAGGWSRSNLVSEQGPDAIAAIAAAFPDLQSTEYDLDRLDLDAALDGAEVVLVHEWTAPALVRRLGRRRAGGGRFRLLFHDTHHRAVSAREAMASTELDGYDGVLAFGEVLRQIYLGAGWAGQAWTWHEAADTSIFKPLLAGRTHDLVWIGNWGDEERSAELRSFLLEPVRRLKLQALVHGVRYPEDARNALAEAGIEYRGYLANHRVPDAFARAALTIHVPRRPYVEALPGIPTIRVFEALACGIPLITAPWTDSERLFRPGHDYLLAEDGSAMQRQIAAVLRDPAMAGELARAGLATIRARHTCAHRVDELLGICRGLVAGAARPGQTGAIAAGGSA